MQFKCEDCGSEADTVSDLVNHTIPPVCCRHAPVDFLHGGRIRNHRPRTHYTIHLSQYRALYTVYIVHYTLNTIHLTLYTEHYTLNTIHWTVLYTVPDTEPSASDTLHYTLVTVQSTVYGIHCTLYTEHYTLNTIHWTLYTEHYTLNSVVHCTGYGTIGLLQSRNCRGRTRPTWLS